MSATRTTDAQSTGGITLIKAHSYGGIRVRGKGSNLTLPDLFPDDPVTLSARVIASDGVTTKCWSRSATRVSQTPTLYKGESVFMNP